MVALNLRNTLGRRLTMSEVDANLNNLNDVLSPDRIRMNVRPSILLDFANSQRVDSRIKNQRSSGGPFRFNKAGILTKELDAYKSIVAFNPITGDCEGLMNESSVVNWINNNSVMNGTGVPSGWSFSTTANGVTLSIVGSGTENGIPYIDVRYQGTTTASSSTLGFNAGSNIASSNLPASTQICVSTYTRLVSGTIPVNAAPQLGYYELTAGGTWIATINNSIVISTSNSLSGQRRAYTNTTSSANGYGNIRALFFVWFTQTGLTVDFTIRFGGFQLEIGSSPSSLYLTKTGADWRTRDYYTIPNASQYIDMQQGTFLVDYSYLKTDNVNVTYLFDASADGTNTSDCWALYNNPAVNDLVGLTRVNGSQFYTSSIAGGTDPANGRQIAAIRYSAAVGRSIWLNGVQKTSSASTAANPIAQINYINLLSRCDGSRSANAYLRRFVYWPYYLDDATMAAITTR